MREELGRKAAHPYVDAFVRAGIHLTPAGDVEGPGEHRKATPSASCCFDMGDVGESDSCMALCLVSRLTLGHVDKTHTGTWATVEEL